MLTSMILLELLGIFQDHAPVEESAWGVENVVRIRLHITRLRSDGEPLIAVVARLRHLYFARALSCASLTPMYEWGNLVRN